MFRIVIEFVLYEFYRELNGHKKGTSRHLKKSTNRHIDSALL
jgi:hypothetical protein